MNQNRKNMWSTRQKVKPTKQQTEELFEPELAARTNVVYAAIQDLEGHTYTDLTGGFPKRQAMGISISWCYMIMMEIVFKQNQ
jgi:hypothetical protein